MSTSILDVLDFFLNCANVISRGKQQTLCCNNI